MKLFAIADLHLARPENRQALIDLPAHPDHWLIVAGDVCESIEVFEKAIALPQSEIRQVVLDAG